MQDLDEAEISADIECEVAELNGCEWWVMNNEQLR